MQSGNDKWQITNMTTIEEKQHAEYEGAIKELQRLGHELLAARDRFPTYSDIISRAANACFNAATDVYMTDPTLERP